MTNPCFGFGQIHTNNATLVGVTSRCGAGDHIGFTPPLPHRSSPTCICIQPTIHIFCIFVLVILCFLSSRKQELTNLYLYSTHYSYPLYFCSCDWAKQTVSVFVICIFRHSKHTLFMKSAKKRFFYFSHLKYRSSQTCICIQPTIHNLCISVFVIDTDQAKQTPSVFVICILSHPKNFPFIWKLWGKRSSSLSKPLS